MSPAGCGFTEQAAGEGAGWGEEASPYLKLHCLLHGPQMNRNVGCVGHEPPVRPKERTREVQPLLDVGGDGCALQDASHLLCGGEGRRHSGPLHSARSLDSLLMPGPSSCSPAPQEHAPHSPAMLMKRWEKMESWMGSSWGPAGRSVPDPTVMQMSPRRVIDAVQPGSTRMVLGARRQEPVRASQGHLTSLMPWRQPTHTCPGTRSQQQLDARPGRGGPPTKELQPHNAVSSSLRRRGPASLPACTLTCSGQG